MDQELVDAAVYAPGALSRWQHFSVWNKMTSIDAYIYVENIPAKFHPDLIWNDGALGFFEEVINVSNLYIQ